MCRFPILLLLSIVAGDPLLFEGFPTPYNQWVRGNPWRESDAKIFVFIGSYKLSSIPKSADGSKTYDFHHSALVFYRQDEWISLDLFMENPLDVGAMFVPAETGWMNNAAIRVAFLGKLNTRPSQYDSLISVGETNGIEFAKLIARVSSAVHQLTSPLRYDVFSIVNEDGQIIRAARSCFEFIESVLRTIPIKLSGKEITYYRDTVFVRVSDVVVHKAPHQESTIGKFNDFVSNLVPELPLIARHLVYLRVVFAKFFYANKTWWFAGLDNDDMLEVTLSEEYTDNGCKELVTLVSTKPGSMDLLDVVRAGWDRNVTDCALPYQKMTELKKFVTVQNNIWSIGLYVSLGLIIVTGLVMKITRKF